jgi:WD40 repeat protein
MGTPCRLFVGHGGSVEALAFDPSGKLLATGGRDGLVMVWDLAAGKRLAVLGGGGDEAAAATHDYEPHKDAVNCLAWTPDGAFLASGGADCQVKMWRRAADKMEVPARSFASKFTPILHLSAPKPDVFVAAGSFLAG